jgi:hypothetical protein
MGGMTKGSEAESWWGEEFSLLVIQIFSVAHPDTYPVGTGMLFVWGLNSRGMKFTTPPASSPEVKETWIYTSTH